MNRSRVFLALLCLTLMGGAARAAEPGPYVGANLGFAVPTNKNFGAHANLGGTGDPYVGYMFNKYIGLQGELHFSFFPPDNDHRGFANENTFLTLFGGTGGPRLSIPIGELVDIYADGQGGYYTGLSGRFTHSAPGFAVGGGIDYNITRAFSVGAFGRWNRIYMSPHPTFLAYQEPSAQGPSDTRFVTTGISLKYTFLPPAPPPPAAPPPPVAQKPPPPVKKKIILRSVHFDFNKANIRSDAIPVLNEAVNVLKEEGTVGVICAGHTDSIGSDAYNMKLSRRRADAVRSYLVSHGIPAKRIRVEAFGERNPVASNDTADGRAQNRRVELNLD
jgi:outer membrane protein OmpA-like peptidoglycan-associated protein